MEGYGGGGETFDWSLIPSGLPLPLILPVASMPATWRGCPARSAVGGGCIERRGSGKGNQGRCPNYRICCRSPKCTWLMPHDLPDARGHFGPYGGVFVAETLIPALTELAAGLRRARTIPAFVAEFEYELKHYVGRPSPIYHAKRWSACSAARRSISSAKTSTTPAPKVNNCIGQAMLARRMGKPRVIAETGAGQHGVAGHRGGPLRDGVRGASMGSEDVRRQAANVYRMKLLAPPWYPVESGSKTLRMRSTRRCATGSPTSATPSTSSALGVAGPHPYPMMVRDFQTVIGKECIEQMPGPHAGRQPDYVIACVGGGSNAMGIFHPYIEHAGRASGGRRGGW